MAESAGMGETRGENVLETESNTLDDVDEFKEGDMIEIKYNRDWYSGFFIEKKGTQKVVGGINPLIDIYIVKFDDKEVSINCSTFNCSVSLLICIVFLVICFDTQEK